MRECSGVDGDGPTEDGGWSNCRRERCKDKGRKEDEYIKSCIMIMTLIINTYALESLHLSWFEESNYYCYQVHHNHHWSKEKDHCLLHALEKDRIFFSGGAVGCASKDDYYCRYDLQKRTYFLDHHGND